MYTYYYKLNKETHEVTPLPALPSSEEFAIENRRVAEKIICCYRVSTVFLVINHAYSDATNAPPILFETMVFRGEGAGDVYCRRYSTWGEAVEGHEKAIAWVKAELKKHPEQITERYDGR